jgi:hypothetical protein
VMTALPVVTYSGVETQRLSTAHGYPGPWNGDSEPTPDQLRLFATAMGHAQEVATAAGSAPVSLSANVGRKR